jgi:phage terminase large subunit-like protein
VTPTDKQAAFLTIPCREGFFGGAARGGKSVALLMGALMDVDHPDYSAMLFRRNFTDLTLPGALMDVAHAWLGGTAATWNDNEKTWTFPSGATLNFGYMARPTDHFRYQGAQWQYIGFDELTQFRSLQYLYLFSRQSRPAGSKLPLRMMSASNPGGEGHEFVFERMIVGQKPPRRIFVPAYLEDNPHTDQAAYDESVSELDPITRDQLRRGVWVVATSSRTFQRAWWRGRNRYDPTDAELAARTDERWISFDTANTDEDTSAYTAWTVGDLVVPTGGLGRRLVLRDAGRERLQFPDLVQTIEQVARRWNQDGKLRGVVIEDKASGTSAYQTLSAAAPDWLTRRLFLFTPRVAKEQRWGQAAVWCKLNGVWLPHAHESVPWVGPFETELFGLPDSEFKDWGDSFAQLVLWLEHYLAEAHAARSGAGAGEAA